MLYPEGRWCSLYSAYIYQKLVNRTSPTLGQTNKNDGLFFLFCILSYFDQQFWILPIKNGFTKTEPVLERFLPWISEKHGKNICKAGSVFILNKKLTNALLKIEWKKKAKFEELVVQNSCAAEAQIKRPSCSTSKEPSSALSHSVHSVLIVGGGEAAITVCYSREGKHRGSHSM